MSFFPQLDMSQLLGLAIFGFFTGFGGTIAAELVKYLVEKVKKNGEHLKKQLQKEVL